MHDQSAFTPGILKMGELEFRRFQRLIFEAAGIHLAPVKRSMVAGRLAKRVKALNLPDFVSYVRFVDQNPAEYQLVVNLLTTNETYFFRESKHFGFLADRILRDWERGRAFNAWSAACSSGEEAYSLAMILSDCLEVDDWQILASDISTQVLERAEIGHYPMSRAENIPEAYLKRFCLRGTGQYTGTLLVDRALKQKIQFRRINLMEPIGKLPSFDLIMLRNVLIYFEADTKAAVVKRITSRLSPGGYLFIGHSETLNGLDVELDQMAPAVYRKCL